MTFNYLGDNAEDKNDQINYEIDSSSKLASHLEVDKSENQSKYDT